jgi:hypothetical protein
MADPIVTPKWWKTTPTTPPAGQWTVKVPRPGGGFWEIAFATEAEGRAVIAAIQEHKFKP